ncbi:HAD-IA family hydrolase [Chelatococcus sp. SYSU_G07232]|uniref:HAD-IA family hydrolase n=1 Tax=Chelatococcus albus TaxID=3047466 RepID=A0ABT7AE53_9HYPH|nr:HAD-IA family hydrolase [Chelatococcus sp. SYSU_G07232]MDJ1157267.1 HAD-IA family hydrolase [Chelatococcus sp. SYSU_G07232]
MRLVVFDVDGTLVDSQNLLVAAQAATFAAHGLAPPPRERSLSVVGLSLREAFLELVGPEGPHESLAEGYKTAFQRLLSDPVLASPLFPGAVDVLASLGRREEVMLGIATGKSRRGVSRLFDAHGWHRLFHTVQTADDAPSKPHPAMLLQAMAEVGAEPGETVMVGDTTFDVAMARAAGCRAVGVAWGYHPAEALRAAGAEEVLTRFEDLPRLLPQAG